MSEVLLPKFSFNNASVKTDEEFNATLIPNSDKYFRAGLHTVTITKAEYKGKASDPNWGKVYLTLTGTGEKTILDSILIPERDIVFVTASGKKTGFLYQKFQKFMSALGTTVKVETLGDTMAETFTNVGKTLVGQQVQVEIGYQGNHVAYLGKTPTGATRYAIKMKDGSLILSGSLETLEFSDVDSAKAYGEANQIDLDDYMNVLAYTKASGAKLAAVNNW